MKSKVNYLVVATFLAGCSQGGSGGGGQAPSPNINSKITGSASNALTGQTAIFEASKGLSEERGSGRTAMVSALLTHAAATASAPTPDGKTVVQSKTNNLAGSIQSGIQNGSCQIQVTQPESSRGTKAGAAAQFQPVKMKVAGTACPVEINFDMSMASATGEPCQEAQGAMACKFAASVKVSYRVLNDQLANDLGVRSGHTNMVFNVDQTMPAGQPQGQMNMVMKGDGAFDLKAVDLQGQAHLISGTQVVNMKMVMDIPTGPQAGSQPSGVPQIFGAMKEELQYLNEALNLASSLSATINMNGSGADEKYFVDGVSVTANAYASEREKFANSMMAFGNQDEEQEDQAKPAPGPGPRPGTGSGSGSKPMPMPPTPPSFPEPGSANPPVPAPVPQPPATDRKWACMVEIYQDKNVFIGYGSVEFVANSKAKQACQGSGNCSSYPKCEEQEADPTAWYCQTKNSYTGRIFSGVGASKTEAGYFARKDCFNASGTNTGYCQTVYDSDCVHQ